jgi:hypothetical protein
MTGPVGNKVGIGRDREPIGKRGRAKPGQEGKGQHESGISVSALADCFLFRKLIPRARLTHRPDDGGSKVL